MLHGYSHRKKYIYNGMWLLNKPDFIVAGQAKTGTTWLYSALKSAPGFKLPPVKELSFFNEAGRHFLLKPQNKHLLDEFTGSGHAVNEQAIEKTKQNMLSRRTENTQHAFGAGHYFWGLYYRYMPRSVSPAGFWLYSHLFAQQKNVVTGDISPLYFTLPAPVIELMAQHLPQVKIVIILRNPVEREWSNIRMNYFAGPQPRPFDIHTYLQKHNYQTDYRRNLNNWLQYFGNRLTCLFYDDLKNNPQQFFDLFVQAVKPGAGSIPVSTPAVGRGVDVPMPAHIRQALIEKNLPQYQYLAQKFGQRSYPAQWLAEALAGK